MKQISKKLSLNKKTVAVLDDKEMASVKGGFTYSLSTGRVCRLSNALTGTREECQETWKPVFPKDEEVAESE